MATSWLFEKVRAITPGEGEAPLFGVVLYTDRHVYVKKVLADEDYWKALDELSGPRWFVFAARGEARPKGFIQPVWEEPEVNKELLADLDLPSTESFPSLAVFAEDDRGVLHRRLVPIDAASQESVFRSLGGALKTVAATLEGFLDENRRIPGRAFEVAKEHLDVKEDWEAMKKIPGVIFKIKDLVKKAIP
jgi:hypothetical protein